MTHLIRATGVAVALFVMGACSPSATAPPRPALPAGWTVTASGSGDLRLALPADLVVFDASGAIFANQRPSASGADWIQVMAEGPATAVPQPDPGESLDHWLDRTWFANEPERGASSVRALELPTGPSVELRTVLGAGTGHERRVTLYAIRTPAGVGRLVIDGPPDLALVAALIELGPSRL